MVISHAAAGTIFTRKVKESDMIATMTTKLSMKKSRAQGMAEHPLRDVPVKVSVLVFW